MFSLRNASEADRMAVIVVERYVSDFVQAKTERKERPERGMRQGDGGDGGERAVVVRWVGWLKVRSEGVGPGQEDQNSPDWAIARGRPRQSPDTPFCSSFFPTPFTAFRPFVRRKAYSSMPRSATSALNRQRELIKAPCGPYLDEDVLAPGCKSTPTNVLTLEDVMFQYNGHPAGYISRSTLIKSSH